MSLPSEGPIVKIPPLVAEILLLPISKYKRPPYWNSTSGFDLVRRSLHVILYQATKFRPNRSTHCGNMT